MLRIVRLQKDLARRIRAAGAARDLREQLERTFGRAVVRELEHRVGGDNADHRHVRKVEALGDHLGAYQNPCLAPAELPDDALVRVLLARGVVVHAQHRDVREEALHFLLHALRARAEVLDVLAPALRADRRDSLLLPAVVAAQRVFRAVVRHGDVALGAGDGVAAAAAGDERRVAAPVDEQNRLLARVQAALQAVQQRAGEDRAVALGQLLAHINDVHLRHRPVIDAARHGDQRQVAPARERKGAHARRGAGQQQRGPLPLAAHARQLARVVARRVVRDVAALVLLVDDDEAHVFQRRKDRRARADDHAHFAPADAPPLVIALSRGQARVQHRRVLAKARAEPHDHLRRQRDFRHEHDGRLAQLGRVAHGADEHLRLAAARHAVEQKRALPRRHRGQERIEHVLLLVRELRVLRGQALHRAVRAAHHLALFQLHKAHFTQRMERRAHVAQLRAKRLARQFAALALHQQAQYGGALGRALLGSEHLRAHGGVHGQHRDLLCLLRDALAAHLRREHEPKRLRQRAERRLLDFLRQLKQGGQHGGIVLQRARDVLYAALRQVAVLREAHDHTLHLPLPAEGNVHAHAGTQAQPPGHAVGEHTVHILVRDIHDHLAKRHARFLPTFSPSIIA